MSTLRWTSLTALALLAASLLPAPLHAADNTNTLPAWPKALDIECLENCDSTLTTAHDITFITRLGFPLGSALLTSDAKTELLRMLTELETFARVTRIEVIGHADPSGPENFNVWLSKRRGERVADFFRQSGVDPRMLSFDGLGSADPLPGAIDPSEHRRTEVHITVRPFL
ncbi:MAG: OmpA family protein [Gammaproteobacteria bacterium]|nr:OmpA family protein [Gammaproteobacteria bacterium]